MQKTQSLSYFEGVFTAPLYSNGLLDCCLRICCWGNVFTETLPSNVRLFWLHYSVFGLNVTIFKALLVLFLSVHKLSGRRMKWRRYHKILCPIIREYCNGFATARWTPPRYAHATIAQILQFVRQQSARQWTSWVVFFMSSTRLGPQDQIFITVRHFRVCSCWGDHSDGGSDCR
jgi:hypothetical protein